MLRSLIARWDPTAATGEAPLPSILLAVRILVLVVVLVTVPLAEPHLGAGARGTAVAVALVVSAISCVTWLAAGRREHLIVAALAVLGVAGGALAGLSPLSPAIAFGCMATSAAGVRLKTEGSLAITAGTVAAFLAMALATGAPAGTLLGYPLTYIGFWVLGLTRRAYLLRAEQAEQTLAETRRAHDAETQAAALAERARMAREIHDVLAHSLAAVSVNLQAAEGLLGALPAGSPELAKAIECVGRAEALTRDGLAEARRAILALRDDAAPLPDQLSALAEEYRADGDAPVDFQVAGVTAAGGRGGGAGRLPDRAGGADQRAQARAGAAGQAMPPVLANRRCRAGRQPAAGGAPRRATRGHRQRARAYRSAGTRGTGRGHADGGTGRRGVAGMPAHPGVSPEGPAEPVSVIVADDQTAVREGLVLLLGTLPGIAVAGEAADGDAAVELVTALHPQVVLMDLNMPGCDGVTATRRITADHPGTRVVVLTTYADDESIISALQAGALGYLTKDATRAEIGRAVLTAAAGQGVLDPAVQQRLLSAAARAHDAPGPPDVPAGEELTPREAEVLRLIADGRSNREIARALFVSEATVKTHVNRIFAKTGSRDRAQAIRYAYTHGYAEAAPSP